MNNMGDRLKRLRIFNGIKKHEIASILGVSQKFVDKVESNEDKFTVSQILFLSDMYNVDENFIIYGDGESIHTPRFYEE